MWGRRWTGIVGAAIGFAAALPGAAVADTPASATFTRVASDSSGQTLQLVVTAGSVSINYLVFTLNDTADGASDTFLVSQVSPTPDCGARNPSGSPHGVECSFVTSISPGAQRTITFVTNPKFPNLGGGQLYVNGGPPIPVSGPPDVPPVAILSASQSATNPLAVNLDATRSYDPDGTIVQYFWSFGDATGGNGPSQMTHTYSAPGTYTITLEVTDDSGSRTTTSQTITITAPPPSTGAGSTPPSTLVDLIGKDDARQAGDYLLGTSAVLLGIAAISTATVVGAPLGLVAGGASFGADAWALFFYAIADDPPDPNFHVTAQEATVKPPRIGSGQGIPRAVARAANALFANGARTQAALQAFVTSLNRYSGAVQAGDAGAEAMQTAAAAGFARQIATGLQRDLTLRATLVKALRRAHVNFAVTAAQVRSVLRHRLPAAAARALARLGLTPSALTRLRRALSHAKNPHGGSLLSALGSRSMARAEQAMASYLAAFAAAHGG